MKILIVDDDLLNRRIMSDILAPYGTCDLAVNGYDAMEAYERAVSSRSPYDLIALDIVMPGMDGRQVLKQIRADEDKRGIPAEGAVKILMVTSEADADSILDSYGLRCDAYITKPIEKGKILDRMSFLGII